MKGAGRSSIISLTGSVVSAAAGFVLSLVLARALGTVGAGVVFQLISVFTIATAVAKLGLDTTAVWLLPRLRLDGHHDERRAIGVLIGGSILGGCAAGAVTSLLAPVLGAGTEDLVRLLQLSGLFLPASSFVVVALAVTRGLGGIRDYVLIGSVGLPVGRLAAVAVAAAFIPSAVMAGFVWLAMLIVAAVPTAAVVISAARRLSAPDDRALSVQDLLPRIGAFAGPRTVSAIIEQALLWLDVLIVGLLAGPAAAGVYGVASRLVQAGTIPSTSMRIVVAPQFSHMIHRGQYEQLSRFYTRTTQWIVLSSVPIYVILVVMATPILSLFGSGFSSGSTALMIMCIGALVSACTGNVQSLLLMSGRSVWAAMNKIIVLAVSVTLLFALIPGYGIVGAAVASTVSVSLDAVLASVQVRRGTRVRADAKRVLFAVAVSALATAVPAGLARLLIGDTALALILGAAAAIVVWAASIVLLRRQFALATIRDVLKRRNQPDGGQ